MRDADPGPEGDCPPIALRRFGELSGGEQRVPKVEMDIGQILQFRQGALDQLIAGPICPN